MARIILALALASGAAAQHMSGGDADNHGCLSSAGYDWCVIQNPIELFAIPPPSFDPTTRPLRGRVRWRTGCERGRRAREPPPRVRGSRRLRSSRSPPRAHALRFFSASFFLLPKGVTPVRGKGMWGSPRAPRRQRGLLPLSPPPPQKKTKRRRRKEARIGFKSPFGRAVGGALALARLRASPSRRRRRAVKGG